ncbi:hypothetical protein FACS1894127_4770 [Clostridia bacterium]|nr:hypothetical protein FACS1894127_4770 [Clostridia bacterium]
MENNNNKIEKMVLTALMTALVAVMTIVIAIPVPFTNGYIHFGDSMIFMSVLILGWKRAPIAAGVGSAMADIFLGYVYWAPWTLVIKGLMALVAGLIILKCSEKRRYIVLSCGAVVALWVLFNLGIQAMVHFATINNPTELMDALETNSIGFGALLAGMQRQLMIFALLIPVGLVVISIVLGKKDSISVQLGQIIGLTAGGLFMVFGYFIAGGMIYGNFAVAAFSIPANIIQFVAGFFSAALLAAALMKTPAYKYFLRFR